nr:F-box/kelch-repeat protein At1g80440-like [Ipomoea batatas]
MNKNDTDNTAIHNILTACKRELRQIEIWMIAWVTREQNITADKLATMAGTIGSGLHILKEPPDEIKG